MKTHRQSRGFMLINLLIALGLMAAFVVVSTRLFRLALNTSTAAARVQENSLRLEQATHALQQDVWHATKIDMPDASHLHLTGNKLDVTWTTTPTLARSEADQRQEWPKLDLHFERQETWIVVTRQGAEVALLRQLPVQGGAQ
jgi:type II secretory pathway component PulJ